MGGSGRGSPFFGFGDPFGGLGGMPSIFGGRDLFDDPFFTRPFDGIFSSGPGGSPFMDLNPFGSRSLFGPRASSFMNEQVPRLHGKGPSLPNNSRGPIIEELNSDDEKEEHDAEDGKKEYPRKNGRSEMQPYIEHPDDEFEAFRALTYGGSNGAYHTSSMTRRSGSDGLRFEEYKEAESVTGQAAHRLSRGIHEKGHTVTRNLKSDGQVDTMQVLHNINEDEFGGFEEAWKGKANKHLPAWTCGPSSHQGLGEPRRGGWALPSTERSGPELMNHGSSSGSRVGVRRKPDGGEHAQSSKIRRR